MPIFEIKKTKNNADMQGYFSHCSSLRRTWREEKWNRVQPGWRTEAAAAAAAAQQPSITSNIAITSTSKMSTTTHFCVRCDKNRVEALAQKIPHVAAMHTVHQQNSFCNLIGPTANAEYMKCTEFALKMFWTLLEFFSSNCSKIN